MLLRAAVLAVTLTVAAAAQAGTDWPVAARAWQEQLQELQTADAARRLCGVPASPATVSVLRTTVRGLRQALAPMPSADASRDVVKGAGGPRKLCANSDLLARARATLAALATTTMAETPPAPPAPPPSATAPTPVVDPDIPLIRGCRGAVNRALGPKRTDNKAFWTKYEGCIADQGAGWY